MSQDYKRINRIPTKSDGSSWKVRLVNVLIEKLHCKQIYQYGVCLFHCVLCCKIDGRDETKRWAGEF